MLLVISIYLKLSNYPPSRAKEHFIKPHYLELKYHHHHHHHHHHQQRHNHHLQRNLINVADFPEEDQQLLMELYLFTRAWKVGLQQWIVQEESQTFKDKLEIL